MNLPLDFTEVSDLSGRVLNDERDDKILSAKELAQDYDDQRKGKDQWFLGETLAVCGDVRSLRNVISAVVVRISGIGDRYSGTHLEMKLKERRETEKLTKGEQATLKGICRGLSTKESPTGEPINWIQFEDAVVLG